VAERGQLGAVFILRQAGRGALRPLAAAEGVLAEGELGSERAQRIRNLLGTWSITQIRNAPRPRSRWQ